MFVFAYKPTNEPFCNTLDVNTNQNQYPRLSSSLKSAEAKFPELLARDYARILQRVELLWGTKEAVNYLDSVILGDGSVRSERQGFPIEILNEIALLKQMHEYLFPSLDVNPYDPFSGYTLAAPAKNNTEAVTDRYKTSDSADSVVPTSLATPAAGGNANKRLDWPEIMTQRELIEKAELLLSGEHVYELQGKQIGNILVHYRLIDEQTLRTVRQTQQESSHKGKSFGQILIKVGVIRHEELVRALCIQAGILMVDILQINIPFEVIRLIPSAVAREKQVMPTGVYHETLFVAVADPVGFKDHFLFSKLSGFKVIPVFALRHEIVNRFNLYN